MSDSSRTSWITNTATTEEVEPLPRWATPGRHSQGSSTETDQGAGTPAANDSLTAAAYSRSSSTVIDH